MSPQISKQFRALEDLVQSQEPSDRINFIGTDISPVLRADPPTLDLLIPTLEDVSVIGPLFNAALSTVPDGFYREILHATVNHDDPVDLNNVRILLVRDSDGATIAPRTTITVLADPVTVSLFGGAHLLIPPLWNLLAQFTGLAAGQVGRIKSLHIDRALGLGNIK